MLVEPKLSYPGVYVAEASSLPGAIPGIPTAVTAFVGRTRRGPTDEPLMISSFTDFEVAFGGLWERSPLSHQVKHFFDNGGSQAYIVRIHASEQDRRDLGEAGGAETPPDWGALVTPRAADGRPKVDDDGTWTGVAHADGVATITLGAADSGLTLRAANPGEWGNGLRVEVDRDGVDAVAAAGGVPAASLFNLTVHLGRATERHGPVSTSAHAAALRIDRVLSRSQLIRAEWLAAWDAFDVAPIAEAQAADRKSAESRAAFLETLPRGVGGDDGFYLVDAALYTGDAALQRGLYQLEKVDIFNLLVIPRDRFADEPAPGPAIDHAAVFTYVDQRRAFWILDVPIAANGVTFDEWDDAIVNGAPGVETLIDRAFANPGALGRNAAVFYPDTLFADPQSGFRPRRYGPAGAVAGIFARTDNEREVWRAPAGVNATVLGLVGLGVNLNDAQNGVANRQGINCFRAFEATGTVLWGSRTLRGAEALNDEFKYIPVRRLSLYVSEAIRRGLIWAVFETNDEALWSRVRTLIDGFMSGLMMKGAFQGATKKEAFFVRCGLGSTMTPDDIQAGICTVEVGFAPVKPAEFVVLSLKQQTARVG